MILLLLIIIIIIITVVVMRWKTTKEPFATGDLYLASMYRQIHLLERVAREKVAKNNSSPGSDKDVARERLILEKLARDSNKLSKDIRDLIEVDSKNSIPKLPTHYATNPMIGLPSQVGRYVI